MTPQAHRTFTRWDQQQKRNPFPGRGAVTGDQEETGCFYNPQWGKYVSHNADLCWCWFILASLKTPCPILRATEKMGYPWPMTSVDTRGLGCSWWRSGTKHEFSHQDHVDRHWEGGDLRKRSREGTGVHFGLGTRYTSGSYISFFWIL